jgi:hypothetical protein
MDQTELLLAQMLSLSGLVAATAAYAGMVRRRNEHRLDLQVVASTSQAAVTRVIRHVALSRLDQTFIRSAYRRKDRRAPFRETT